MVRDKGSVEVLQQIIFLTLPTMQIFEDSFPSRLCVHMLVGLFYYLQLFTQKGFVLLAL